MANERIGQLKRMPIQEYQPTSPPSGATTETETTAPAIDGQLSQTWRQQYLEADRRLNAIYRETLSRLSPGGKSELKREQIAWIQEKERKCNAITDDVKRYICLTSMTNERIEQLKNW